MATTTVNIHEAKTHPSRLVDQAAKWHEFVIAKAGKPMVRACGWSTPSVCTAGSIGKARSRMCSRRAGRRVCQQHCRQSGGTRRLVHRRVPNNHTRITHPNILFLNP